MDAIHANAIRIVKYLKDIVINLSESLDMENILSVIKTYEKSKLTDDNSVDTYETCFKLLKNIDELVNKMLHFHLDPNNHSETFIMEHRAELNKFNIKYTQFLKEVELLKPNIVQTVGDSIFADIEKSTDKLEQLAKLRAKYYDTPELINLYAYVMQKAINAFMTTDRTISYKLMEFITEDKNKALSGNYKSSISAKDGFKKNPPQTRFGLLPMTINMPLKELLKLILVEDNIIDSSTDLERLAKKYKIGFIVLTSVVNTPADYNVVTLTNPDVAKAYIQPEIYGITKKVVDRFNTLKTYGDGYGWAFTIKTHNENAEKFYILETLDNDTYRCLAPWLSSTKYSVLKFRVKKIIDYDPKVPSRALEYHGLAIKQALPNMFTNKVLALDEFDAKLESVESGTIQHKVVDAVMKVAQKLMDKKKIKSSNEVSNLLHNEALVNAFVTTVEQEFASDKSSFDGGTFPRYELMSSFITALQSATRHFTRELHNGYTRNPLRTADFTNSDNKQIVSEKVTEVIKNAIELVIKLDDNLFTSSYYKYLILNYNM
jgi:hypothetical protein